MSSASGFDLLPDVLSEREIAALSEAVTRMKLDRSRAGLATC
jgi:hypothetical protein